MKLLLKKHILLVDDEVDVRLSLAMLLEAAQATVTEASSGTQALALYSTGKFDCVVTDYNMPGLKGDALARAVKTANPRQRVVMVSGFPEAVLVSGHPPWFIDALLPKPCALKDFLNAMDAPGPDLGLTEASTTGAATVASTA